MTSRSGALGSLLVCLLLLGCGSTAPRTTIPLAPTSPIMDAQATASAIISSANATAAAISAPPPTTVTRIASAAAEIPRTATIPILSPTLGPRINARGTPQVTGNGYLGTYPDQSSSSSDSLLIFLQYSERNGSFDGILLYTYSSGASSYGLITGGSRGSNDPGANTTFDYTEGGSTDQLLANIIGDTITLFLSTTGSKGASVILRRATADDYYRAITTFVVPTPVPIVCTTPSASWTARQVAENLLKAALVLDFACAKQNYAIDNQPKDWGAILGGAYISNGGIATHIDFTIQKCRGLSYQAVERQAQSNGVSVTQLTFVFDKKCIDWYDVMDTKPTPSNKVAITLEHSTGRWYVSSARIDPS